MGKDGTTMNAVLEYNDRGCMLFSADCPGAFARGRDRREAMAKLPGDVRSFCRWATRPVGAHSMVLRPRASNSPKMPRRLVVLPVPGPPVSSMICRWAAMRTPERCSGA